jgi:phage baseplate assembly protein W
MPTSGLYKGYSSFEFQHNKNFSIRDVELVKLDLLNHIFTKKGERVMMPNFGTIIPELVFEPLDEETIETIQEELEDVFDADPRVEVVAFDVSPDYDNNRVIASAKLLYVELNLTDNFELNIQFED